MAYTGVFVLEFDVPHQDQKFIIKNSVPDDVHRIWKKMNSFGLF